MSTTILFYIICFIIALVLVWIGITEYRFRRFFVGTKAQNFEKVIMQIDKQIKEVKETQIEINNHLEEVDKKLNKSIRNIETIRFNPFEDAGSNQSFAISLLNDEGNGVVLSSLYARDRMSIFAKPIKNCKSDFELSEEENNVLLKSIKK